MYAQFCLCLSVHIFPPYFLNFLPNFWDRSNIHTEKSNKMQQCIKIYYSIFIWSSTRFGRHTAHHQEPKTPLAASGFAYVEVCWTCGCWTLTASRNHTSNNPTRYHAKPEAASAVLGSWWWAVCRPKYVELHINME